jgi:hypothetical protein
MEPDCGEVNYRDVSLNITPHHDTSVESHMPILTDFQSGCRPTGNTHAYTVVFMGCGYADTVGLAPMERRDRLTAAGEGRANCAEVAGHAEISLRKIDWIGLLGKYIDREAEDRSSVVEQMRGHER